MKVTRRIRRLLREGKRKITNRLEPLMGGAEPREDRDTEFTQGRPEYQLAGRTQAISCGGIGAIHQLAQVVGLTGALDARLDIIQRPKPYRDSDHVLNIAYNLLCGGGTLQDIEHRRNDATFLDALDARAIPDPTTAGDFCRRFDAPAIWRLLDIINDVRVGVWQQQGEEFLAQTARIDVDGTLVPTTGECKEGMGLSYKGIWGYHPLVVTLANTREPLFIVNRSGNRPSHEGAPEVLNETIDVCRRAGFEDILLRGDTDFSMTASLDIWTDAGVRFVFGYDANRSFVEQAENLPESDYCRLVREADWHFTNQRAKQPRVKEEIVVENGYRNLRLVSEDIAEFEHRPSKAKQPYRIVVLRKRIIEERGQKCLGTAYRYFFYVTNDHNLTAEQVVAEANDRCDQENIIGELKNAVRALHAPVNTLDANWAYMVIASLAWTFKAWFALHLPTTPRWRERHEQERQLVLRMSFRTFLHELILVPAQILRTGRRIVFRVLAWRSRLALLFRLHHAL